MNLLLSVSRLVTLGSMSSLKDKIKMAAHSAATIATNIATGEDVLVDEQTYMKRMAACQKCDKWVRPLNQCGECSCFLSIKGRLAGQKCPLDKWKT